MHTAPTLLAACELVVDRWEQGDLAEAARVCNEAIGQATKVCPPWVSAEPDIHKMLARKQQIASVWGIEDVQSIRPDLDDRQSWEVLKAASRFEDANIGINWDVLASHAEILFGSEPETEIGGED